MHIFWATFAAFYVSALAFVVGQITGHVVVAQQPSNFERSNESLVVALLEFAGLVIVGLMLGMRRTGAGARAVNRLPPERSDQRRADAVANAVDRAEESAVIPAIRAVRDIAELEVVESVCESRVVVQPPSKPSAAPCLTAPRIITGKSREAVARAWVGGSALIVVGGAGFVLGGLVPFSRPITALLAVLGLALVTRAVSVTVARRRVGKTWVHLRNSPIAPGSELEGVIWSSNRRLRHAVRFRKPLRPARVRLLCLRGPAPTRRETSMTNSALVWQKEVAVASGRMTVSTGHLGVPFRFDVPADVPEMSRPGDADPIVWLLSIEMAIDAVALAEQFALPIYAGPNSLGHGGTISDRG